MRHAVVFLGLVLFATATSGILYEPGESSQIGYLYDRPKITFDTPEMDVTTIGTETTTGGDADEVKNTGEKVKEPVERRKKSLLT